MGAEDVVNLLVRFRVMDIGKAFCRNTILTHVVARRFSLRAVATPTLSRQLHSHHAREEKACVVLESKAQASQPAA